jgi:hypothetical protein
MAPKTATRKSAAGSTTRPRSAKRTSTAASTQGTKAAAKAKAAAKFRSRAVLRTIEAGSGDFCEHCDEQVKFRAREKLQQAICNVYVKGTWDRVEHFHAECYEAAGRPYGEAEAAPLRQAGNRPTTRITAPPAA